jgi:hypothetical protein
MVRDHRPGGGSSLLTSPGPAANALGPGKQTKVDAAQPASLGPTVQLKPAANATWI